MASAAGGTSHRLNPGLAMILSRASRPGAASMLVADIGSASLSPPVETGGYHTSMSLNGAGQAPRAVSFALLLLTLLPIAAPARPSFVTELNQIRAAGCDGRPGVNEALRPNRKLDA